MPTFNAGIGITVPIDQIMEVINWDDFVKARMASVAEMNRLSGHRDTSAGRLAVPLSDDAEPNHRERFTALLDAAVKKPAPKD
jgi:hypothetical protein